MWVWIIFFMRCYIVFINLNAAKRSFRILNGWDYVADVQGCKQCYALRNFSGDRAQRFGWFSEVLGSMTKFAVIWYCKGSLQTIILISFMLFLLRSDEALPLTWFMMSRFISSHCPSKNLSKEVSDDVTLMIISLNMKQILIHFDNLILFKLARPHVS